MVGRYEKFIVTDDDNEVIPKPYFGHKGQRYIRKYEHIRHPCKENEGESPQWLGTNTEASFRFNGYYATLVGPSPKEVGDKINGNTEKSAGYDDLTLELGGNI